MIAIQGLRGLSREGSHLSLDDLTAVVVDDSADCLAFIEELTRMAGFQVRSFSCPLNALQYVRENTVDVVFTDFRMPKMDGLTFMREIRKTHHDIPIVIITGEPATAAMKEFTPNIFVKPFRTEDFLVRVRPLVASIVAEKKERNSDGR